MGDIIEMDFTPLIGEIYVMTFTGIGSEQTGLRPGLVFQNNVGNKYSPNIIAIPLTSSQKKTNQPTHVPISAEDSGLHVDSVALCENPQIMSKERIGRYITTLSDDYMKQIAEAYLIATAVISYLDVDALLKVWRAAKSLNKVS